MNRVLIVGPNFFDYNLSIEKAFKNLAFETRVLGYTDGTLTSLSDRVKYHLSQNKESVFNKLKEQFNKEVLEIYYSFKPDLVFIVQGGVLTAETMKMIKCKKVLWMMDSISRDPEIKELSSFIKSIDYVFFFEEADIDFFYKHTKQKSWFLPLAVDTEIYRPQDKPKEIDILFVGALYDNRISLLAEVADTFKDKKIQIYGNYYSPLRRPLYHLFRNNKNVFTNKNISPAFVNNLYNQSKVCLNIHHPQSKFGVNQRFFEISGSKSFQLVDVKGYITQNFSSEVMTYSSNSEMIEKIQFALNNLPVIENMALKAYQKVIAEHTFTHRIRFVLDVINNE